MGEKNYILSEEEFDALMGLRDLANGLVLGYSKREQEQSAQESCFQGFSAIFRKKQVKK
jgi:hypothetical protein